MAAALDLFPDGELVWLRSRANGAYLSADEDGVSIDDGSGAQARASLNAAWAVHRVVREGNTYVLLYGTAYGRYLGVRREDRRIVLRVYDAPEQVDFLLWVPVRAADGSGDVLMRHGRNTAGAGNNGNQDMQWTVRSIPLRQEPPALPDPNPNPGPVELVRMIAYVRADDQGRFDPHAWSIFWFNGRSVIRLRAELALRLGEEDFLGITLCVRAGSQGRLTPLVTDLPANEQGMEIVVLTSRSRAALELKHPDVDASFGDVADELMNYDFADELLNYDLADEVVNNDPDPA